jgi:outer membrane receptor protein involved in Fe transport
MFSGGRGVLAASVFYKHFDQPIESVVLAAVQSILTFQNADRARNAGLELEAAREFGKHFFVNASYTFVDSNWIIGKYLVDDAAGAANGRNPANNIVDFASRSWTDINGNFEPDRVLLNPLPNGECGPTARSNFGTVFTPSTRQDPDTL